MEQLDAHECAICHGDLQLIQDGTERARCDDCGADFAVEWDMDGDSDGMHYSWQRDGERPIEVRL